MASEVRPFSINNSSGTGGQSLEAPLLLNQAGRVDEVSINVISEPPVTSNRNPWTCREVCKVVAGGLFAAGMITASVFFLINVDPNSIDITGRVGH